ncbi:MAG: PQQ-binding-like beta-propeller repeat protein, partial [Planctomycetales bacterium]|nr:PQQ-binding-like beta-propeller repeat protein [Planctomycetales bacterium]
MFDQSLLATWFDLSWMFPPATMLSERLGWVLLHTTWQFSLIVAIAGIVARTIQGRSANARYVLLLVALILMAFTPLITWSVIPSASASAAPTMDAIGVGVSRETAALSPTIGEELAPPHSNRAAPAGQQAQLTNEQVTASNRQMPLVTPPESPTRSASPDWKTTLVDWFRPWLTTVVWIWCIGAVGFSLRPLVGWKNVRRLRREGVVAAPRELDDLFRRTATTLGIVRSVDLLSSPLVRVPVVVGWLRPAVLLPVSIMGELPVSQIEGILAHELAHIRRHDYLINMFQTVLEAIFFYHPAVWWLSHHIRLERENCCDDWAVHATGDRLTYGRALLALEDLRATEPILALSAGKGPLVSRIHRVLQIAPVRTSSPMSGWSASGVVAIVAVCVGLCAGLPAKPTESKDESNTPAEATNPTREAWPMGGGSPSRVNASPAKHLPAAWNTEKGENIAWQAPTGTISYGSPVVSAGKVLVGANNGGFHIQRYPPEHDLACLLCFDAETGEFLWQYSSEKLQTGRVHDWPMVGLCSTPCIVDDRVWLTSNRGEVVCLDLNGFTDDENDGPLRDESSTAKDEADVIWKFDMMGELGVSPLYQSCSSPVIADDLVLVCTSNGVEEGLKEESAAPDAPAFIALNRHTGKLVWQDNSPGVNNLGTQCPSNSPTVATIAGRQQAIFPGSDGWLYAFDVAAMQRGATELLWKFDVNDKRAIYRYRGVSQRNVPMSAPVFYENKVYVTTGRNPEHGDGDATLWCIDPSKRGDLSQELVYNRANPEQPIPHKRLQACDESQGDFTKPNPNSGVVWQYRAFDLDNNGKVEFEETFHRTIGSAAIDNGLLFVADYAGIVHCLDATSGKLHWTHDALAQIWSTPVIADGKVYVCDEDGDVTVFRQSATKVLVVENVLDESVFSTPAAVDRTLFIGSRTKLFACRQDATRTPAEMALDNPSTPVERENAPPHGDD